jgi:hypothetical protein
MKPGYKKISRRKPGDTSPKKYYFNEGTQAAILVYQQEQDFAIKNKVYTESIAPAFQQLVENLINVYKYQVALDSKEDLRNECVHFLFTVLNKFNIEKGSKAFAYFNVVAMNWLSIKSKQSAKGVKTLLSMDNQDAFSTHEKELIEHYKILASPDDVVDENECKNKFIKLLGELKDSSHSENEKKCLNAIEVILNNDNIEIINKRAVMEYIRNLTKLTPKQLSTIVSGLKKKYKDIKKAEAAIPNV